LFFPDLLLASGFWFVLLGGLGSLEVSVAPGCPAAGFLAAGEFSDRRSFAGIFRSTFFLLKKCRQGGLGGRLASPAPAVGIFLGSFSPAVAAQSFPFLLRLAARYFGSGGLASPYPANVCFSESGGQVFGIFWG